MIEFYVLGATSLRDPSGHRQLASVLGQPKRLGLLAYLTLATKSGFIHRDKLMGIFWPESSQDRARNSLRQSVYWLRQVLGAEVIVTNGDGIRVDHAQLWCDATAFQQALDEDDNVAAVELYIGELLPGLHLSECAEFEMWLEEERARLKHSAERAVLTVIDNGELDPTRAIPILRRALRWNPYDETTLGHLVSLLAASGDRAGAVLEYQAFRQRLAQDLDVDPSPETETLMEEIRENHTRVGGAPVGVEHLGPAVATVSPPPTPHPPVVVRRSWLTRRLTVVSTVVLASVLAIGSTCMVNGRRDAASLDPTRVLVDIFQNETGVPSLDHLGRMATDRITQGLTYTTFVDVVSLGTPLLSREPIDADGALLEDSGRLLALARANGTGTVVSGSYYLQGDSVYFQARITNAADGQELAAIVPAAGLVDAPVAAVEQLRGRVMTTLATLTDPRLAKWMRYASKPPTFEAYQEFVEGMDLYLTKRKGREAILHFQRAAAIDSSFTMPLLWGAFVFLNTDKAAESDSVLQELNRRRHRLAPTDRHFLDYQLAHSRADWPAAQRAVRRLVEIAPSSAYLEMAGVVALLQNRPRQGLAYLEQVDPESGWLRGLWPNYWWLLSDAHHLLGNYRRALEAARVGRDKFPDQPVEQVFVMHEIKAMSALGLVDELAELIRTRLGGSLARYHAYVFHHAVTELRYHGYSNAAADLLEREMEPWANLTPAEIDTLDENSRGALARVLNKLERWEEWRALVEPDLRAQLEDSPGWSEADLLASLGEMLARTGDREEAVKVWQRLAELGPRPLSPRFSGYGLRLQADIAAALGERERATSLLREAFAEGLHFDSFYHTEFLSLQGYPPFEELIRPKG